MILLRRGRVMDAGRKHAMLTAERLSTLFDAPIQVSEAGGYFQART